MTVFPRDKDGTPFIWDYQMKGMFKDACGGLRSVPKTDIFLARCIGTVLL